MSSLIVLSAVMAICLYIPLCVQILQVKVKQNFATWILWATLDVIAAGTLILQDGNYWLPVAYTVGTVLTTICIAKSGCFRWTSFESLVTFMVIICVVIWMYSGSKTATVVSSLALAIAGVPQLIDSFCKPKEVPFLIYLGFFVTNTLSVMGAKDWSIEERFYPATAGIFTLVIVVISMRRFWFKSEITVLSTGN